jgi:hypothetical protein
MSIYYLHVLHIYKNNIMYMYYYSYPYGWNMFQEDSTKKNYEYVISGQNICLEFAGGYFYESPAGQTSQDSSHRVHGMPSNFAGGGPGRVLCKVRAC